jgi:hypothetical protein
MEIVIAVVFYLLGIATWALIGYGMSRNETPSVEVTQEEIAEAIAKALK